MFRGGKRSFFFSKNVRRLWAFGGYNLLCLSTDLFLYEESPAVLHSKGITSAKSPEPGGGVKLGWRKAIRSPG